jgi:hypothetical protein
MDSARHSNRMARFVLLLAEGADKKTLTSNNKLYKNTSSVFIPL